MARSLAPRLSRPFAPTGPRGGAGRGGARGDARGKSRRSTGSPTVGFGPFSSVLRPIAGLLTLLRSHRRLRLGVVACVAALALLSGSWLALRNSPLVSVERVRVTGVHGASARAIEAALSEAARHMSTLDVHIGVLRAAVAPFRVVRDLHVTSSFPHGLRIGVLEQLPVAALSVGGVRTAVAADGVVLGPALLGGSLPALTATAAEPPTGERIEDQSLLQSLALLGAAPESLAHLATRVYTGPRGLTVTMRNGLQVYFGDAGLPHAKWLSLARVLADGSSTGATYVDVRLPERPAAGFPSGLAPTDGSSSSGGPAGEEASTAQAGAAALATQGNGSESTASALAAGLQTAAGGGKEATTTDKEAESSAKPQESGSEATSGTGSSSSSGAQEAAAGESGASTSEADAPSG